MRRLVLPLCVLLGACVGVVGPPGMDAGAGPSGGGATGGGSTGGAGATGGGTAGGSTGGGAASTGGGAGGGASGGGAGGGPTTCLAGAFLSSLGRNHLLAGGSFDDAQAGASWDGRSLYLSGLLADGATPCASCASACTAAGLSCANTAGCGWWGCWQYDVPPPGDYARGFVTRAKAAGQVPMFTYYLLLQASGLAEGTPEVAALADQAFLTRYFNDFRLLLRQIGADVALLHLEPDFWGYAQHLNANPHLTAAKVTLANPTDCATQENSASGFGRCLVAMVRKYAPNAKVGLHASAWATLIDVLDNRSTTLNVPGEAVKLADFLAQCGGAEADFVAVDPLDRDAGYYQHVRGQDRWWDVNNATLPNFTQAFTWARALAERLQKPVLWWQVPIGNAGGNDTANHYRDNRVDYFFAHPDELARSHAAGFFFGAGADDQTTAATDNGNLVTRVNAYRASGGQAPCP